MLTSLNVSLDSGSNDLVSAHIVETHCESLTTATKPDASINIGGGLRLTITALRDLMRSGWYHHETPVVGEMWWRDPEGGSDHYPATSLCVHYVPPPADGVMETTDDLHDHVRSERESQRLGAYSYVEIEVDWCGDKGVIIHAWGCEQWCGEHTLHFFPARGHHARLAEKAAARLVAA